jgi:Predicted N-acetylglucosaminyl transferase
MKIIVKLLFIISQLLITQLIFSQNNPKGLYLLAEEKQNNGQNITAIELYTEALKSDNSNAKAYLGRARSYYIVWLVRDEKDSAIYYNFLRDINRSIQLDSTDCECNFWVAEKTKLTYDSAIKFYNRAIHYCNNNEAYFSHRAFCLMHLNNFQLAINDINNALRLTKDRTDPDMKKSLIEDYLCYRAICYAKLNNLKMAEKDLNKAIDSNDTEHTFYLYLGTVKAMKGEYNQALDLFKGIIRKNPLVAVAYLFIGNIYNKINEPKLAEEYWSIANSIGYNN